MTELSDKLLVAYVDGQLAREQNRAVEKVLEQDDVIAARVKALQEGHSKLEAAFEAILAGEVSEISAQTAPVELKEDSERGGRTKASLGVAGIVILLIAAAASYGWPPVIPERPALRDTAPPQEAEAAPSTWQREAVRVTALLSRVSLEGGRESQGNLDLAAARLAQAFGPEVKLPDLEPQGFRFMRAQLLKVGDIPMAQMLYLPPHGAPLGLYATLSKEQSAQRIDVQVSFARPRVAGEASVPSAAPRPPWSEGLGSRCRLR